MNRFTLTLSLLLVAGCPLPELHQVDGITCTDWSVVEGTNQCLCNQMFATLDRAIDVEHTYVEVTSGSYGGFVDLSILPHASVSGAPMVGGRWDGSDFDGVLDPMGRFAWALLTNSSETSAAACEATYGSVEWSFDESAASAERSSSPADTPATCLPGEGSTTTRTLVALPGSSVHLAVADHGQRDAGQMAQAVRVIDFGGASQIRIPMAGGHGLWLDPTTPVVQLPDLSASELAFQVDGDDAQPRIELDLMCAADGSEPVPTAVGYRVDPSWLPLVDPAIGQDAVVRFEEDAQGSRLRVGLEGHLVGGVLPLEPQGQGSYALTYGTLQAIVRVLPEGLEVSSAGLVEVLPPM